MMRRTQTTSIGVQAVMQISCTPVQQRSSLVSQMKVSLLFSLVVFLSPNAWASARTDYMLNCMGCHMKDGSETPGKVPALKGEVSKFLHVEGGRVFLIQVPGTSQSRLSNGETAEVLNFIVRTFDPAHLPRDFQPFTSDEVATHRQHTLIDPMKRRRALAEGFSAHDPE
jgi:hypothetical protein